MNSRTAKLLISVSLVWVAYGLQVQRAIAQETLIDFESCDVGKPLDDYYDQEVRFELAHPPKKTKAKGRIMFFPHLGDDHKGILNAMADEAIPLKIQLPRAAVKASLTLWGATTSAAVVEAFDQDGKLLAQETLEQVPVRAKPEDHVPYFTLTVESPGIALLHVSGAQPGGFLALDELRLTYEESTENPIPSDTTGSIVR